MAGFAGPDLAAAVSNAGGLGIVGAHGLSPEELVAAIRRTRELTARPFGVNLLFGADIRKPPDLDAIASETVDAVNKVLNPIRQVVGLDADFDAPAPPRPRVDENLEVAIGARIPVLSFGLGNPGPDIVERCHAAGVMVIAMATTVNDAQSIEAAGVDAVVAQGREAGGHRSHFTKPSDAAYGFTETAELVTACVDALRTPVIAAGGINDSTSIRRALDLGAQGVLLGTRFLATQESLAVASYKQALVVARGGETTISDAASGRYARLIRNTFLDAYPSQAPKLPYGWHGSAAAPIFERARELDDSRYMPLWAGESVDGIDDVPTVADLMRRLIGES